MNQLEILKKRIQLSRLKKADTRLAWKARVQVIVERPISINYLTIGELSYILQEIQKNYLAKIHYFTFGQKRIHVRILEDQNDTNESESVSKDGAIGN